MPRRVLVSRPEGRADELSALLLAQGDEPVLVPLISICPPDDSEPLSQALVRLAAGGYDWLVLTSAAGARAVLDQVAASGIDLSAPGRFRVAVVGRRTAQVLGAAGIEVDLIAPLSGAELVAIWPPGAEADLDAETQATASPQAPVSALLAVSDLSAPTVPDGLARRGVTVDRIVAYRTVLVPPPQPVAAELAAGGFAAVLLTSPSTVAALRGLTIDPSTRLVAIGRTTAGALAAAGRPCHAVATDPSPAGLVTALNGVLGVNNPRYSIPGAIS